MSFFSGVTTSGEINGIPTSPDFFGNNSPHSNAMERERERERERESERETERGVHLQMVYNPP
jgi:hypothetical protein